MDFLKDIAVKCWQEVSGKVSRESEIFSFFSELRKRIIEEGYVFKLLAGAMEFSDTKVVKISFVIGKTGKDEIIVLTGLGEEETVEKAYEKALYNLFWQIVGEKDKRRIKVEWEDRIEEKERVIKEKEEVEKEEEKEKREEKKEEGQITSSQKQYILSLCKSLNIDEDELRSVIKRELGKDNLDDLTKKEASALIDSLSQAKKSLSSA